MSDLVEKFTTFIENHQLILRNNHVLVAVSGGIDSVVLLHLLVQLRESYHLKLTMIHLNHGLRGDQADRDQRFVEQLAKEYQIPIVSRKINVPKFMVRKRLSEEIGARILRYHFFERALKRTGADCLALGHQANDQIETVIDHFLRGSGVKGLSGIPLRRDKFIRPLLGITRQEIETYAKTHSLQYMTDATNVMVRYRRNRIRHELIPYLQKHFNPGIGKVMLRSAEIMQEVEIYLNGQARLAFEKCLIESKKNKIILDIHSFLHYFSVIQKYVLYLILDQLQLDHSTLTTLKLDRILTLIQNRVSGKKIDLTPHWTLWIDHDQVVIRKKKNADFQIKVAVNKTYHLWDAELSFIAELIPRDQFPQRFSGDRKIEYVDQGKIQGPLVIRNFRTGDHFKPLNLKGEKKLADFFTDLKLPIYRRQEIPLLVCDTGIIWVVGYQIDDRFKVTERTEHILRLQIKKESPDD